MGTRTRTDLPPRRATTQLTQATNPGTRIPMRHCDVATDPRARPGESYRRERPLKLTTCPTVAQ